MWTWYDSKITKIEDEAPNVKRFWLEKPDGFEYRAGQFITLDLPIHEKRRLRWRSYSIANQPTESEIELCIVFLEGGLGTSYLFNEAKVGTPIKFKGAHGSFTTPKEIDNQHFLMIATGTGLAPIRAMIQEIMESDGQPSLDLVFGTRTNIDVLYKEDLKKWLNEPNFNLYLCLSREKENNTAYGSVFNGYVHGVYQNIIKTLPSNSLVYACGWNKMTDEVAAYLKDLDFEASKTFIEGYG